MCFFYNKVINNIPIDVIVIGVNIEEGLLYPSFIPIQEKIDVEHMIVISIIK